MENLTVEQLEELITLAEEKLIHIRDEAERRKEEEMIGTLRDMRLKAKKEA